MRKTTSSFRFISRATLASLLIVGGVADSSELSGEHPRLIEVFTTVESPVAGNAGLNWHRDQKQAELHVYSLDGIQRLQTTLSRDLPNNPKDSKRIVLQRIQQLAASERTDLQHSAVGLAKAVQYGVDRYPAIVFDSKLAIYGVTDLREALRRYQRRQESNTQ